MGGVDLTVPVPQRAPARTGQHRCLFVGEAGIDLGVVRCGLLRYPRRPVLHPSTPSVRSRKASRRFHWVSHRGWGRWRGPSSLRMKSCRGTQPCGIRGARRLASHAPTATADPRTRVPHATTHTAGTRGEDRVFWMVALLAQDGLQYVYRVYAPDDALPADLFWTAFHCHDDGPRPRASDRFDAAEIWRHRQPQQILTAHQYGTLAHPPLRSATADTGRTRGGAHGRRQRRGTYRGARPSPTCAGGRRRPRTTMITLLSRPVPCGHDKKRAARGAVGLVLAQEPAATAGRPYRRGVLLGAGARLLERPHRVVRRPHRRRQVRGNGRWTPHPPTWCRRPRR
ncbi:hypothetical protein SBADM41S_05957 [Streptomyces badius]